jgi:GDPmannose 4,6-dehydratase
LKIALITGVTGQDGSYLAEHLLGNGYAVHGVIRHSSVPNNKRITHLQENRDLKDVFFLHDGDLSDAGSIINILVRVQPDEIYNLAAQSHVKISYSVPELTSDVNALGPLRILEAIRILDLKEKSKFYQSSTSEIFGQRSDGYYDESAQLAPNTPYGISKLYAHWATRHYREVQGLFACNGILFSHESPRRGENFVSRKICRAVVAISQGDDEPLRLGNILVERDWGHAADYVRGIHSILNYESAEDFVLSTGETHTLKEFVQLAFAVAGIHIEFFGVGIEQKARDMKTGKVVLEVDPRYFRPHDELVKRGNSSKALRLLNWKPKYTFEQLVSEMVESEMRSYKEGGFKN